MAWLLAACASCLVFAAAVLGTFVPLQNPDGVEYLFAAPPAATLAGWWLPCAAALAAAYFAVRFRARSAAPSRLSEAATGTWLAPVAALGVVALGVAPAIPGVGEHASVVAYLLYDLRWWWAVALAALAGARVDRLVGEPLGRAIRSTAAWSPAARLLALDSLLFVGVVAWALATTANALDGTLGGDEPKYVRYCEAWYQGQGLDISGLALVSDEPLGARPPLVRNATFLADGIPRDIGFAVKDLRDFASRPAGFRWNRAEAFNGFVTGIHGGLYEEYSPGTSVVLFPGYLIDRYLLNVNASEDGKWPAALTMTKLMMLLTYGLCGVMLFRLLRHALASEILAWTWAALAMLTLPTTAFAFQLYPELPALFVILAVSNALLFGDRTRLPAAALAGAATGALAWLHVRFLLVAVCLTAFALVLKAGRARWAFLGTCGLAVFSVMIFNYHVTGSWWPTALWDANGIGVSFGIDFVRNFIGYAFDRRYGLLPHSLILIGALPGLFVLGRQNRPQAGFVAVVVVALVAPSAGHTLVGAATTPDRLIMAVTPLLVWPVAVLVREFWLFPVVRVVTASLAVLSLDAARAYNWSDAKRFGLLRDASLSGWKPNLAFPDIRGEAWEASAANFALLLCLAGLVALLAWLAFRKVEAAPSSAHGAFIPQPVFDATTAGRRSRLTPIVTIATLVAAFTVATSANNDWTYGIYVLDERSAQTAAARAVVSVDRCFCFTSGHGRVDWSSLGPNSARSALIDMFPEGLRMTVLLLVQGDSQSPAFGRMRVEFGDGEQTPWTGVLAEQRVPHVYRQAGTYEVRVWFQLPSHAAPQVHAKTVEVREGL